MSLPPWKAVLEHAIEANVGDRDSVYVQLATVKPNGRPSNRTVVFRGFYQLPNDFEDLSPSSAASPVSASSPVLATIPVSSSHNISATNVSFAPASSPSDSTSRIPSTDDLLSRRGSNISLRGSMVIGKLTSLIEFVTDIRSSKCLEDLAYSNYAEVCWYFPATSEQFRLSGTLHLVTQPDSVLARTSTPAWAPKRLDWEQERLRLWKSISPALRATFSWPRPGSPVDDNPELPLLTTLACLIPETPETPVGLMLTEEPRALGSIDLIVSDESDPPATPSVTLSVTPHNNIGAAPHKSPLLARSKSMDDQNMVRMHDEALSHFGVLMLDVDFVDYVCLKEKPHKRVQYKVHVPERTWGRITGLEWEVKKVHA